MGDFIFLIIPLIIAGVLARLNSKVVADNVDTAEKWFGVQTKIVQSKTGIAYRLVLLPILKGFNKVFTEINTLKNPGMRSGAIVAFLIYAVLFATLILGVAVFFFIYSIILLVLVCPLIWFLDKRGVFTKSANKELIKIKQTSSTQVIDLNKAEDSEFLGDDELQEVHKLEIPDLDEFGLKKKR
jgi:hypothetical protein